MRNITLITVFVFSASFSGQGQASLTPEDILSKMSQNLSSSSLYTETEMRITIGRKTLTKTFISFSEGPEKSFIEFLGPQRDRGTKILKIGKVLKIYFPSAGRIQRYSQHMLKQRLMGSDFSYEDITERDKELNKDYTACLLDEEEFQGVPCFVVHLESKTPQSNYYTQKIWVDKKNFVGRKVEFYARSGKLLKVLTVDEVRLIEGRFYPVKFTMQDKLRTNTKTEIILKEIRFDTPIPEDTFTERNLLWGHPMIYHFPENPLKWTFLGPKWPV